MIKGVRLSNTGTNIWRRMKTEWLFCGVRELFQETFTLQIVAKAAPLISTVASYSLNWEGGKSRINEDPLSFGATWLFLSSPVWLPQARACQESHWEKVAETSSSPVLLGTLRLSLIYIQAFESWVSPPCIVSSMESHLASGHYWFQLRNSPRRLMLSGSLLLRTSHLTLYSLFLCLPWAGLTTWNSCASPDSFVSWHWIVWLCHFSSLTCIKDLVVFVVDPKRGLAVKNPPAMQQTTWNAGDTDSTPG